jgi:TRAP-type uncharacterized transport system substrate-binding protein
MKRFFTSLVVLFLSAISFGVMAEPTTAMACPSDQIILGTGTPSGTYGAMFRGFNDVCPMVCPTTAGTQGGFDNLTKIIGGKFDAGIIQSDLLAYLNRTEPRIQRSIRSLASIHSSQLHIIINKTGFPVTREMEVKKPMWKGGGVEKVSQTDMKIPTGFKDFEGQKVVAWSSAYVTAIIIGERLRLNWDVEEVKTRAEGFEKIKSGKAAAFLAMAGRPAEWIENDGNAKVEIDTTTMTLMNLDPKEINGLGAPYFPMKTTYRNIKVFGWNLLSSPNEIVVKNFPMNSPQAKSIGEFKTCLAKNLETIKASRDHHPAWDDVEDLTQLSWTPYQPPVTTGVSVAKKR